MRMLDNKENPGTQIIGSAIYYFDELDSTNSYSKRMISEETTDGTVIIAGRQSGGRGRLGREWFSPPDTGIYLSIILKPEQKPEELQLITLAASVAVVEAIENAAGIVTAIKWPNDILLGNKKICGILTEMVSENESVKYIIVGIGINISEKPYDFPAELFEKAAFIISDKNTLLKQVLKEMDKVYSLIMTGRYEAIIDKWKRNSSTLGREISILSGEGKCMGVAEDITNKGELVIALNDGSKKIVQSGEISIRGVMGYI